MFHRTFITAFFFMLLENSSGSLCKSNEKQPRACCNGCLRVLCYCLYFAISSLSRSFDTPKYLRMFSSAYAGRSSMK